MKRFDYSMDTESFKKVQIHDSWQAILQGEFNQPYMSTLHNFLMGERQAGRAIYPVEEKIFSALNFTVFDQVKVVVLGQDPYHAKGQAHGLSFSVPPGVSVPPSLVNIYKELSSDLSITAPSHGCLEEWAKQGVLLLNSVLTVEEGRAASHKGQGWERFTDKIIERVNTQTEHVVFILWGAYAQKKGASIDATKHLVLQSPHPSPLSAYRGFFGKKPFSTANEYLISVGKSPINWQLMD